jgi:hypothetical protein
VVPSSLKMATANAKKLTLHIDGRRITADRFRRAVDAFLDVISAVSVAVTGEKHAVEWIISVKAGSIDLGAAAEATKPSAPAAAVVHAIYTGFQELALKAPQRPDYFNDFALERARELGRLQDGKAVSTVQVRRSRSRVTVNERVIRNIDRILGGSLGEVGTIEGRLRMISDTGGLHVGVWDALTDHAVRCNIPSGLIEGVMAAFRKRVAVSGTIRYRATGEAVSIDVERFEVFPDSDRLPTADSVYGILSKL